jgi:hypothetical protein
MVRPRTWTAPSRRGFSWFARNFFCGLAILVFIFERPRSRRDRSASMYCGTTPSEGIDRCRTGPRHRRRDLRIGLVELGRGERSSRENNTVRESAMARSRCRARPRIGPHHSSRASSASYGAARLVHRIHRETTHTERFGDSIEGGLECGREAALAFVLAIVDTVPLARPLDNATLFKPLVGTMIAPTKQSRGPRTW